MKIGPKYKICRRLGERVFSKCQTTKFSISGSENSKINPSRGGSRGGRGRGGSEYGSQLIEKQKARYSYGISEHQFARYVKEQKSEDNLFRALESRLDNVIFRLGWVRSRAAGRQVVTHGHILVNNRRALSPSCRLRVGDKITIRPASREKPIFRDLVEQLKDVTPPVWLAVAEAGQAAVAAAPARAAGELNLNFGAIVDFYSRV